MFWPICFNEDSRKQFQVTGSRKLLLYYAERLSFDRTIHTEGKFN